MFALPVPQVKKGQAAGQLLTCQYRPPRPLLFLHVLPAARNQNMPASSCTSTLALPASPQRFTKRSELPGPADLLRQLGSAPNSSRTLASSICEVWAVACIRAVHPAPTGVWGGIYKVSSTATPHASGRSTLQPQGCGVVSILYLAQSVSMHQGGPPCTHRGCGLVSTRNLAHSLDPHASGLTLHSHTQREAWGGRYTVPSTASPQLYTL